MNEDWNEKHAGMRYLLMVEGGGIPNKVHYDLTEATQEAERLCQKERKKVYLFGVMDEVMIVPAPVVWKNHI